MPDPLPLVCPDCGNRDRTLISRWIEPSPTEKRMYCEVCGHTWTPKEIHADPPAPLRHLPGA